jgi:hypothetical protein
MADDCSEQTGVGAAWSSADRYGYFDLDQHRPPQSGCRGGANGGDLKALLIRLSGTCFQEKKSSHEWSGVSACGPQVRGSVRGRF